MATSATSNLPVVPVTCSQLVDAPGMTRCARLPLTQEARVVVVVDCDVIIQLITPPDADVFMAIDEKPEDIGPNRMPYLSMPLPTDALIAPRRFRPGQTIVMATKFGVAVSGIIIERLDTGAPT